MSDTVTVQSKTTEPSAVRSTARVDRPPATALTIRVIEVEQLSEYREEWTKLSEAALAPNVFYEPWMLLPAAFSDDPLIDAEKLRFLLVLGPLGKDGVQPLWGFFPLEVETKTMNLPVRSLTFWRHHRYFYLTVPLIHTDHALEVLNAFWHWFEKNPFGCRILDTNQLLADGPFHAVWADFAIGRTSFVVIDFPRAFLEPSGTAAEYFSRVISKKHFDEFRRLERRLGEVGKLEYRQVAQLSDVEPWVDQFLQLEAKGWKGGTTGRAFAKEPEHVAYLQKMTREGFLRNRVMLLSLVLDSKVIAMKHNVLTVGGGFAFRIAYDESYAKYSPGVLLELENVRRVCDDTRIQWMDSCADPRHVMANRLWKERRMIRRTLFSNGSWLGDLLVSTLPFLRWIRKQIKPQVLPAHFQISTRLGPTGG
jgi:hypothetical protein